MINRTIQKQIEDRLFQGKVVVIYGARQVGKTTLAKQILGKHPEGKYFLCDNPDVKAAFTAKTASEMGQFIGDSTKIAVLDDAQSIENIGTALKLLVDTYPELQIIATGSSSFELANNVVEPLTGRKFEFKLYPLSVAEVLLENDNQEINRNLERILKFGLYPDIYLNSQSPTEELIEEIKSSYLFKDILTYKEIKSADTLTELLQLLALQIGSEVSYGELSKKLGIDIKTVKKYIDLLEKKFVIKKLPALSRNSRTEINKSRKIYFYDLGIRNSLIRNFNPMSIRQDVGGLWENFCVIEKIKSIENNRTFANYFFWRTWEHQEVDFIVERDGNLAAYEIKWGDKKSKPPSKFKELYPNSTWNVISRENYLEILRTS